MENDSQTKKMGLWQKMAAGLLALALVGLVIFFGAGRIREKLKPLPLVPDAPVAVEITEIEPSLFTITSNYTGTVEAVSRAMISAQVSAMVEKVFFREGQAVKKGDLLIRLDDQNFLADTGKLEATATRIQADIDFWKIQAARDEKLFKSRAVSAQKRDESKRMLASLKASFKANEQSLLGVRVRLGYTKIYAPFSGVIQQVFTETGEVAVPGKALVELVETRHLKAVFSVPQKDVHKLFYDIDDSDLETNDEAFTVGMKKNKEVLLTSPFSHKRIQSRIFRVYPALNPASREAVFEVLIPESANDFLPGMSINAKVILAEFKNALVLPRSAIHDSKDGAGVYIVKEKIALWRPIITEESLGTKIRILSGLNKGDRIIITPDPRLRDGCRINYDNNWRKSP